MIVVSDTSETCSNVVLHLGGDGAKLIAVVVLAPQRQRQDRHIVNGAGLDERLRDSRRHAVEVRVELAVDLDQRVFLRRADQKAHDDQALPGSRSRVHILDARDLVHQVLDGQRDALFHLGRRRARHRGRDVQHGNQDLRLLLARNDRNGECSDASDAAMNSGVSLELRKVCASFPAMPSSCFMAGPRCACRRGRGRRDHPRASRRRRCPTEPRRDCLVSRRA